DDAPGNDPIPPSAPKNEPEIVNTGCSSNVVRDEHLLFHPSARCLVCPAETTTRETTSRKWFSLVSTMVLACGEGAFKQAGVGDGAYDYVTLQAMQKYLQTFGHCSQETYDWHMHSMEQKDFD